MADRINFDAPGLPLQQAPMALQDLLPPCNISVSDLIHRTVPIIQVAGNAISTSPEDYIVENLLRRYSGLLKSETRSSC
jgi:hypothetical protein